MSRLSYSEIVEKLQSRRRSQIGAPALSRVGEALARLRIQPDPERVIVVAGTNGKGSVCATLDALLLSDGERTGLYTSPHLMEPTERFRIAGRDFTPDEFREAYSAVSPISEELNFTPFETMTLMAGWAFLAGHLFDPVDRLILECGLGGRWDAANTYPHRYCAITRLGLDHENELGAALSEIALHKFGVVTPGSTVVYAPLEPALLPIRDQVINATQSQWIQARECSHFVEIENGDPQFYLKSPWGQAQLALPGSRGAENSSVALTLFESLGHSPALHLAALAQVRWPGRMERHPEIIPAVYFSGDHNPQGASSLFELLGSYPRQPDSRIHFLIGMLENKDREKMLGIYRRVPGSTLTLTDIPGHEASSGSLSNPEVPWIPEPMQALRQLLSRAQPQDLVVITGSLYLVGYLKAKITSL